MCATLQVEFSMTIYEEHIRYGILCAHELCEEGATVVDPEGFSPHLNEEQLNKVALGCHARVGNLCRPIRASATTGAQMASMTGPSSVYRA